MGTIRLLLAISVVIGHTNPLFGQELWGGVVAVELFFIISGFYMALILNEKYNTPSMNITFYKNRFLKLFPIYWAILVLTVFVSIASWLVFGKGGVVENIYNHSGSLGFFNIYIVLSNIFLFGEDLLMFLGVDNEMIVFTKSFSDTALPLHKFIIIPQSWTLSLEIMFYMLAPFIARKRVSLIVVLFLSSFFIKIFLSHQGFSDDPWKYRFILSELQFFFVGIILYKIYIKITSSNFKNILNNKAILTTLLILFFITGYFYGELGKLLYPFVFIIFIFLLPILFEQTKNNKIDRFIGEQSYPVYIVHIFVLMFASKISSENNLSLLVVVGSILFSIILNKYIQEKVEKTRKNNLKKVQNEK